MTQIILPSKAQVDLLLDRITDVRAAKIDLLDTTTTNINTNVGSNADAANSTGSIHAKLKDLKQNINNTSVQTIEVIRGEATITSNTYQTVLNIAGRGILKFLSAKRLDSSSNGNIKVTMDDVLICNNVNISSTAITPLSSEIVNDSYNTAFNVTFIESLKIEASNNNNTTPIKLVWVYELLGGI